MSIDSDYLHFNREIYDEHYKNLGMFSNVISAFTDIENIPRNRIDHIGAYLGRLGRSNGWGELLRYSAEIPLFLGLIHIQVYAAAIRSRDDDFTEIAYNPRLQSILGLRNVNELEGVYRANQKALYAEFERWCRKHCLSVVLSENSRRVYCQYPLSLSLLHKTDIESLNDFFYDCGLSPFKNIELDNFISICRANRGNLPPRISRKWNNLPDSMNDYKDSFRRIIYSAYLNWDGTHSNYPRIVPTQTARVSHSQCSSYTVFWDVDDNGEPPLFYFDDEEKNEPHKPQGAFYIQDRLYRRDWEYVPLSQLNAFETGTFIFAYKNESDLSGKIRAITGHSPHKFQNSSIKLYVLTHEEIESIVGNSIRGARIQLVGGVKVSRDNTWLLGALPEIYSTNSNLSEIVLINPKRGKAKKIPIANKILKETVKDIGDYYIRYSSEYPAIRLNVVDPDEIEKSPYDSHFGWNYSQDMGFNVCENDATPVAVTGLDYSLCNELFQQNSAQSNQIRLWLDLSVDSPSTKTSQNDSIINKTIWRAMHGICNR